MSLFHCLNYIRSFLLTQQNSSSLTPKELCINYCNEALQQQFNRFVFKAEQAEYEYEGIEWYNIEFPDNQEALDLIEDRLIGIFSVLDEQCKLPKCTDDTFVRAVYDKCDANVYFEASDIHKSKVC